MPRVRPYPVRIVANNRQRMLLVVSVNLATTSVMTTLLVSVRIVLLSELLLRLNTSAWLLSVSRYNACLYYLVLVTNTYIYIYIHTSYCLLFSHSSPAWRYSPPFSNVITIHQIR